jgi:Trypsin-co-occurring domain 1
MATRLIRLSDGTLVEAEVSESDARPISGGAAEKVAASFEKIEPVLVSVCRPVARAWHAIGDGLHVDSVQIELGLSFEGEGNVFVSRAKAGANLVVTLTVTRHESPGTDDGQPPA